MFGRTQRRFRRRRKLLSTFNVALGLSLLFHLSMLTIFNVVAIFPVPKIDFYTIEIVQSSARIASAMPEDLSLDDIDLGDTKLDISGLGDSMELPTIEFSELERLRVRQPKGDGASPYDTLYDSAPENTWGVFSGGLQQLGQSLRGISLGGVFGRDEGVVSEKQPAFRPAEGFVGYIEWADSSNVRNLLFAPPIKALWDVEPSTIEREIELVFEVNAEGRIVNVYSPSVENQELLDAVQLGVLQYRFEPIEGNGILNQLGTLRISGEGRGQL